MTVRELIRKHPEHVTIAHISDLHFRPDTKFPPDQGSAHLGALIRDIKEYEPDILAVTGDVADNPFRDALKRLSLDLIHDETGWSHWNQSLDNTLERSRQFLRDLCQECHIDDGLGLFVVPGNHDYRLKGTYSGWLWKQYRAEALKSSFAEKFAGCGGDETFTIICRHAADPLNVVLRLVCLDSNDSDAYLNFATGAITQRELNRIDSLGDDAGFATEARTSPTFRVCLVHHHPLPVVTAEALRDLPPADALARAKSLITTLTGEQTNMLKNGGTFLLKCLDNKVDLILHGHQHRSWFSNLRYPATSSDRRLLVAGASSAAVPVAESFGYCIYQLDVTGNINVAERKTNLNPIRYSTPTRFSLYDYSELRKVRRTRLIDQLEDTEIAELGCSYGVAAADEVVRLLRIDQDGNAQMTMTYKSLLPRKLKSLPEGVPVMGLSSQGFVGLPPPNIRILYDPHNYYTSARWDARRLGDGRRGLVGRVIFTPPLNADYPVSLEIEFLMCNAFQFVREYRRATSEGHGNREDLEHHNGRSRAVYARVATEIIVFPPRLGPLPGLQPQVHVSRDAAGAQLDEAETAYWRDALCVTYDPGTISLSVREPLPGCNYRISWHLRSESEFDKLFFDQSGIAAFEALKQRDRPSEELQGRLSSLLGSLKDGLPEVIDDAVEMSLYLAVVQESGFGDDWTIKTVLHRFAHLGPLDPLSFSHSFAPGEGLVGQAFRSRREVVFKRRGQEGSRFYVVRGNPETGEDEYGLDEARIHSVLYCIPLPVIQSQGANVPTYGVLSVGTFQDSSKLRYLNTPRMPLTALIDFVRSTLNQQIQEILGV